ncbi:hypothetical protein [Massilia sp. 9096]|uniref:AbiU2 domain-containing protein n=1 Tax=Massilia sp. 9096 TaxID=1500894 RepID=UPI00055A917D|nr:hypothetical protein [Massilia sp. 9096]
MGTAASTEKIIAHATYLLNDFLQLRERYEMLHPMLFDENVNRRYESSKQGRGFTVLRRSLFLSCCQDIAKLMRDFDSNTPSIKRILTDIAVPEIRADLRQRNCDAELLSERLETDPTLAAIYRARERDQIVKYETEFDRKYDAVMAAWANLKNCAIIADCYTIRNKITAHTEVLRTTYQPIDISKLGITYRDLKPTIDAMEGLVEMVGGLVRGTSFTWERFNMVMTTAATDFWHDQGRDIT